MPELAAYLPGLLAAWGLQIASGLTPGPVVAAILTYAASGDRRGANAVALGTATAAFVLAALTALGLASAIATFGWSMQIGRWLGVVVLLWLAWRAFHRTAHPRQDLGAQGLGRHPYLTGLTLGASSPKALAYWAAMAAIAFTSVPPVEIILIFAVGAFAASAVIHRLWAAMLVSAPVQAAYASARRWIDATLGVFFTFAAFKLATSRI
ncbi:LysE family transporter [Gymnodinialimonas sp. 2305UL16-5]|uniref:LysE family translocator n=1 Tax=Gymnodinialimonas mytili TaxID=3126503 RepID=UPI0030B07F52